jgi:hypothetical protein
VATVATSSRAEHSHGASDPEADFTENSDACPLNGHHGGIEKTQNSNSVRPVPGQFKIQIQFPNFHKKPTTNLSRDERKLTAFILIYFILFLFHGF